MTEMVSGMSQSQDTGSQPVPQAASAQSDAAERTFRQSEVNDIVKRAKSDAVDTYRRISVDQPQYAAQKYGESAHQAQSLNENDYRKIAAEEAQRHLDNVRQDAQQKSQDEMAKRTVQNFYSKITPGREKYQDFDKVTGDMDLARFPNVVQLLGEYLDNSDDVYYELGKDRFKLSQLEQLANLSPGDAIIQAKRLSQSIKDNSAAAKVRSPNEPLSQMRPTNAGTESGAMSVKDYRKKYKV